MVADLRRIADEIEEPTPEEQINRLKELFKKAMVIAGKIQSGRVIPEFNMKAFDLWTELKKEAKELGIDS